MKKGVIISVCAILIGIIVIAFCLVKPANEELPIGVLARVNGVSITEELVDNALTFNQIQIESLEKTLVQATGEAEKTLKLLDGVKENFPCTKEEVLARFIRCEAVCQQFNKEGKGINQQEANRLFTDEYSKQMEKEQFSALLKVLESRQITMEEYLALGREQSYYFYNYQLAKQSFAGGDEYDKTSSQTVDVQFDAYLDQLVEITKVERVSEQ